VDRQETPIAALRPAAPGIGVARMVVLMCAFGLGTVGALLSYFAAELIAAAADRSAGTWPPLVCAAAPILTGACAVALSLRARTAGGTLAVGCGILFLGALVSVILLFSVML
jgi:hypothetical protein